MRKLIFISMLILLFCLSGGLILAKENTISENKYKDYVRLVKDKIGINIKVVEKANIKNSSNRNLENSLLTEKMKENNINSGNVFNIDTNQIPDNMEVLSFENDEDAAKYLSYTDNETFNISDSLEAVAFTSYTRNYKKLIEKPGPVSYININTRCTYYTDNYGYSHFTSIQNPWFTFEGVTIGMEVVTNSTWKSIPSGGLTANIGGSYTKKQYLLINGLLQLYSTTKNTTKSITPTGS